MRRTVSSQAEAIAACPLAAVARKLLRTSGMNTFGDATSTVARKVYFLIASNDLSKETK